MKKKSASRSAFFNVRVLIGLFVVLAGVFLALAGTGTFSAIAASSAKPKQKHKIINIPGLPPGFDCSKIHEKGIDRMEGLKWGFLMIACGESKGGEPEAGSASPATPLPGLPENCCRSLSHMAPRMLTWLRARKPLQTLFSRKHTLANPDNPDEIIVAFNDSKCASSSNFSAISASTDGGLTFARILNGSGCSPFANTFGDPVILYNKPTQTWFTVWLDANGSCTLGGLQVDHA